VTEAEYREQLNQLEEQLTAVYRERRALTEAWADEHPPVLPPPRYRTDAQARVARCPRCGGSLEEK
jgi:hypothetical protein